MRLWLASYPRSGNTFLRMILNEAFSIKSTSVYSSEDSAMRERPWLMDRIGYAGELETVEDGSSEWVAVKTHDLPSDLEPAIYVVRDGRAAIVSYRHMLVAYANMSPTLSELIEGKVWPGSWSNHFDAWNPEGRKNTLFLKYEDAKSQTEKTCDKISRFLNVKQKSEFTQKFDELNRMEPTLFRSADNERNIAEISSEAHLFDQMHGNLMRKLGYYPKTQKSPTG
jgi:Sulfotransferase domain